MKRSILPALILGFGLVSVAQGQEGRPVEERARPSGRGSAAEPESPVMTRVRSQENQTAEPRLVKFGGVLTDFMGRPLSGEVEVTFALYKQETDEEPLWKETQKLEVDKQGGYTALIGATQPSGVPEELFRSDEARRLGVQIQGEPQGPRILLVSVPYALKAVEAEKLGGKSLSDFVLSESLGEQVRQVIQAQGQVAVQPSLAGTATGKQSATNSTVNPQESSPGHMFPPSTFSGTNSSQIVLVQQKGTGAGLMATSPQNNALAGQSTGGNGVFGQTAALDRSGVVGFAASTGGNGVVGIATSTSSNQHGVLGLNFGAGPGVAGIANALSGFNSGVFGSTASSNGTGVFGTSVQWVGVGGQATATSGGPAFGVWGDSLSTGGTGVAGFEDATSGFTNGVSGQSVSPDGNGVVGFNNSSSGGNGVAGVAGATSGYTSGVFGQSASSNGQGVLGVSNAVDGGSGVNGFAAGTTGNAYGVMGTTATTGFGAGVIGGTSANTGTAFGVFGQANSPNGNAIFGHAASSSGFPTAVVGFLDSTNGGVAGQFVAHGGSGLILQGLSGPNLNQVLSLDANGNLHITGNLTVDGTKSSTAMLQSGRAVALYAVESPENWFEDFGSGEMNNGVAWVPLEGSFAEATNATVTYHVFLTANGDSNGLYVSRKTPAGFEVREHAGSASSLAFDYRIVARRRGYEAIRMAEVHTDIKTSELSRAHLAGLANSGNLKKIGAAKVPRIARASAIRPVPPRPSVPELPRSIVPQPPRPR
jgi:hypothetical protein